MPYPHEAALVYHILLWITLAVYCIAKLLALITFSVGEKINSFERIDTEEW